MTPPVSSAPAFLPSVKVLTSNQGLYGLTYMCHYSSGRVPVRKEGVLIERGVGSGGRSSLLDVHSPHSVRSRCQTAPRERQA
jgi:hypothetical protein